MTFVVLVVVYFCGVVTVAVSLIETANRNRRAVNRAYWKAFYCGLWWPLLVVHSLHNLFIDFLGNFVE